MADFQIATSVRLLMSLGRPARAGSSAGRPARTPCAVVPRFPGRHRAGVPAGVAARGRRLTASARPFRQVPPLRWDQTLMEAATPLRQAHVAVVGDRLVVHELDVQDECAVRLVREREQAGDDPVKTVRDALEIGARVLDREQAAANSEYVKTEFERASRELERQFTDKARTVAEHFGTKVDEVFGPESGRLAERPREALRRRQLRVGAEPGARARWRRRSCARARISCASSRRPTARTRWPTSRPARSRLDQPGRQPLARHRSARCSSSWASSRRSSRRCATRRTSSRRSAPSASGAPPRAARFEEAGGRLGRRAGAAPGRRGRGRGRPARRRGQDGRRGRGRRRLRRPGARAGRVRGQGPPAVEAGARWRSSTARSPTATPTSPCWWCRRADELPARLEPLREYNGDKLLVALDPDDRTGSPSRSPTAWHAPAC